MRENQDWIDLQADKKGFVKCYMCKKRVDRLKAKYSHPTCYCKECWKIFDREFSEGMKAIQEIPEQLKQLQITMIEISKKLTTLLTK